MRIGLTGGIASGKSTVAGLLARRGAVIVDADLIAREVVLPGSAGLAQVVEAFGEHLLTEAGALDRPALGAIVFTDPGARRQLEQILHPLIGAETARQEAEARDRGALVVNDIPLLVESGMSELFDQIVVVDVLPVEAIRRMVQDRGMTRQEAEDRMAAQATREQRLAVATHVIDNNGDLDALERQVAVVFEELCALSAGS